MNAAAVNALFDDLRRLGAQQQSLPQLFTDDPRRFEKFSLTLDDLLLDFSKTALTENAVALLLQLADAAGVAARRDAMFAGDIVNDSEQRAALHVALRGGRNENIKGMENVTADVLAQRRDMLDYAEQCRDGRLTAADGGRFSNVVNIGIGGSDLGPAMAAAALAPYRDGLRPHFVSNMDGAHLADTLAHLDAKRTLVIISSKTFTTRETLENAARARDWLAANNAAADQHLVAVTAAADKAQAFGCGRVFSYASWVGGRYSLWGAVGLPLALAIGAAPFGEFLAGGRDTDVHFCTAPMRQNLPLMLGLVGVWHRNACGYPTRAVLPYDQRLRLLPEYLQQLDMESNGKPAMHATAPVVWGTAGTNAQHAYFQMLHQGTDIVPCEFLLAARATAADNEQHRLLVANCLAQSAALMHGDDDENKPPHRRFAGNRPSVTLLYRELTPRTLGRLIALFEHRAFVEGVLWGINSFDQWGVELGKTLANALHSRLDEDSGDSGDDSSTRGLLGHYRKFA